MAPEAIKRDRERLAGMTPVTHPKIEKSSKAKKRSTKKKTAKRRRRTA